MLGSENHLHSIETKAWPSPEPEVSTELEPKPDVELNTNSISKNKNDDKNIKGYVSPDDVTTHFTEESLMNHEDQSAADEVVRKITTIGKVSYTDACLGRISAAESAYQILTPRQKEMVTNYSALVSARERYESLAAKNQSAASEVTKIIEAIGPVSYTDACLARINAAESAYQSLTKTQKKIVINYKTLKSAQDEYASLKDQSVAERVIKEIKAIGKVSFTSDCLRRIRAAEFAYENLTGPQKKRVMNHDLLVLARAEYESIRERKIEEPG